MKKKIILWIITIFTILSMIVSLFNNPGIEASSRDLLFYRLNGFFIFLPVLVGLLIELDIGHIKSKISLAKSKKVIAHIGFWIVCIFISGVFSAVFTGMLSEEFQEAAKNNAEIKEVEQVSTELEEDKTSITDVATVDETEEKVVDENNDIEAEENTVHEENQTEINANTEETSTESEIAEVNPIDSASQIVADNSLISEKSYTLDNEVYEINGIEVVFTNITLVQQSKPEGYLLTIDYSLNNKNDFNCKFEISSTNQNSFCVDEQIATLSAQSSWSNSKKSSHSLKSNESVDLSVDMLAKEEVSERIVDGVLYNATDIGEIYSNQKVVVNIKISGISDTNSDSTIVSLELK